MSTDALPIFNAALSLPDSIRADLAAELIASLDATTPPAPQRSAAEWEQVLQNRSESMHRGEATMVEGADALARMRAAIERVGRVE
jgi:hypothetical protein